jgi:phosphoribosylaminoimidazole-succinocarboxamide synthase
MDRRTHPRTTLEDKRRNATRAQALAIGAHQDIERAEEAHRQLMRKLKQQALLAAQAHWDAQVELERAECMQVAA